MKYALILSALFFVSCQLHPADPSVACVIRRAGGQPWSAIDDGGHTPVGIRSIVETENAVRVYYDFTAGTIYSFSASVDETMAALGYSVGASVGLEYADVYIYRIESGIVVPVDPRTIDESRGNIWIFGYFGAEL